MSNVNRMSNVVLTSNTDMPVSNTPIEEKRWETLDDFINDPTFEQVMDEKYPREASVMRKSGMNRRQFMQLMGASVAMGGLVLSGCAPSRPEQEEIIPYVRQPEEIVPGRPLYFSTAMTLGGYATGAVLETHEGRPHRIEGNENHPASKGGASAMLLSTVLELYNPNRNTTVYEFTDADGDTPEDQYSASTLEAFQEAMEESKANWGDGNGVAILTQLSSSPSMQAEVEFLQETYPNASWFQYDPVARTNVNDGARLAFGDVVNTMYDFTQADVILSLDSDFLMDMPGSLAYAADFAEKRRVRMDKQETSRLYAVTSSQTNTSSVSDHALPMRAADVEAFTLALASALGADGGSGDFSEAASAFGAAVAEDLQSAGANAVVVAGEGQSAVVHALAHAINAALGAVGTTVMYTDSPLTNTTNALDQLNELISVSGSLEALIIIDGNPVHDAPKDVNIASAISTVPFSVHLSLYRNETSFETTWQVPLAHFIETWGDARAFDGTASVIQPPIGALYSTAVGPLEMLAMMAGDERSAYDIVREYWESESSSSDFATDWRAYVESGVVADTAFDTTSPSLSGSFASDIEAVTSTPANGLEVVIRVDPLIWDGRFSNNPWLQELPNPITKIAWDTVAMMSEATADDIGASDGEIVDITVGNNTMQAPAWIMPKHPDNSITVMLGYGQGISAEVEEGLRFDAYAIRTSDALYGSAGISASGTGSNYELALVQKNMDPFDTEPVRMKTLESFIADPTGVQKDKYDGNFLPGFEYTGNAWGMSIDLTTCIGCNACMVACQSENTIPTIGKSEVLQERDMHWIRVDTLYIEDGDQTGFMPVPCMHCENAPCEQVCPVQATVHDHEGINNMVYNRCVGTRYCSANCPYGVRRFNYLDYTDDTLILQEQRNPDVSVRVRGVMEKCTYCWQRINAGRVLQAVTDEPLADGAVLTACQTACPANAIVFGNINDEASAVRAEKSEPHSYSVLDDELNTKPRTTYLAKIFNPNPALYEAPADESAESEEE
ncbi:MAG: Fe-S-cluster-containing hydrogenase [Chloroflexota bacterium]